MFKKFTNGCVRVVNRWLPDAFLFAVILSIVVFIGALAATGLPVFTTAKDADGKPMLDLISAWGNSNGFWSLLSFSMQMALVLVLGSACASAKPFKALLRYLAGLCKNNMHAIVVTTFVSTICCWLNWGFGLVIGALLAKEVVRRVPTVDYPLLIASAYSGFVVWHAGLSGSIPLDLVAGKTFGEVTYQAAISETLLHPVNLIMCAVILVAMPFINYAMHPNAERTITVDPALLADEEEKKYEIKTPADKIEHSKILWGILVLMGLAYIVHYFFVEKGSLGLNIVNFIFLFLGILLHGDLRRYVDAIAEAAAGAAGVLLQFPFYAGIMGLMIAKNAEGVSLAGVISQFFVSISNTVTFPMLSFLAAGIVNFFVPSGGGQWAVQGPIMMPAGAALGIPAGRTAMAVAWGDQWTNMIQPFWALPALGIAKLSARDVMGYLVVVLLFTGVVACLGFLAWGLLF
ncbi:MAG: short-chain fatty acid transporter [Oscillospiraceae bacterium]|nr:short-chain fatty acid transporter [Oscillospiraceae bacterium]